MTRSFFVTVTSIAAFLFALPVATLAQSSKTIGATQAELNRAHGAPVVEPGFQRAYTYRYRSVKGVSGQTFRTTAGHTFAVDLPAGGVRRTLARSVARRLIPTDAVLQGRTTAKGRAPVEVYSSRWLARRTKSDRTYQYNRAAPGTFFVMYSPLKPGNSRTTALFIAPGNRP